MASIYDTDLPRNAANHTQFTPLSFIERTAAVYPERLALVHGELRQNWGQTYARCKQLASALNQHGIGKNDTVAAILPNIPAMVEAHLGVPMAGAVLNAINTRLDAQTIAFMLDHGEAKAVLAAAVVAKPDAKWGETPCAFIELKTGAATSAEDLIRHCRQHLAGFKVPRAVEFGELPKTSTGKIQKFELRKRAGSVQTIDV